MASTTSSVTTPDPPASATARSPYEHWWITAAIMIGYTTVGLSVTVVNLAFPQIMTSLRADLDQMQWVQTGYMIVTAVMMPSVGWLGSRWGNRQIYLILNVARTKSQSLLEPHDIRLRGHQASARASRSSFL